MPADTDAIGRVRQALEALQRSKERTSEAHGDRAAVRHLLGEYAALTEHLRLAMIDVEQRLYAVAKTLTVEGRVVRRELARAEPSRSSADR